MILENMHYYDMIYSMKTRNSFQEIQNKIPQKNFKKEHFLSETKKSINQIISGQGRVFSSAKDLLHTLKKY